VRFAAKGKGNGVCIAIYGNPSHNYGVSLAVWDHTVLPATRHKRTHPAFTPAGQAGTRLNDTVYTTTKVSEGTNGNLPAHAGTYNF